MNMSAKLKRQQWANITKGRGHVHGPGETLNIGKEGDITKGRIHGRTSSCTVPVSDTGLGVQAMYQPRSWPLDR